jgi:hypothetical protein
MGQNERAMIWMKNVPKFEKKSYSEVWGLGANGMRCECKWKWGETVRNNSERAAAKMGGNFDVLRIWG